MSEDGRHYLHGLRARLFRRPRRIKRVRPTRSDYRSALRRMTTLYAIAAEVAVVAGIIAAAEWLGFISAWSVVGIIALVVLLVTIYNAAQGAARDRIWAEGEQVGTR